MVTSHVTGKSWRNWRRLCSAATDLAFMPSECKSSASPSNLRDHCLHCLHEESRFPVLVSLPPLPAHFIPFSPFRCSDYMLVYHANFRPERKSKEDASVTGSVISSVPDEQLPDPELCQRGKTEHTPATEC